MIITTTENVPGRETVSCFGLVGGEVVAGINFLKDIGAGMRNFFGGRSKGYEEELVEARRQAIAEMAENAKRIGANAVVGVKIDCESMGTNGSMIFVTAVGTAVKIV